MIKNTPLLPLLFFLVLGTGFAEETSGDLDPLFEDSAQDTVVAEDDSTIDYTRELLTSDRPSFSGRFVSTAGIGIGWQDFPYPEELGENLYGSYLALATTNLVFDARPDPAFRLHGKFELSLNPGTGNYLWSAINTEELFCDYSVKDVAFVRFGVQTIKWGQGRLYSPGNLMDDSAKGSSLKVSLPGLLSGVTFVSLAKEEFFTNPKNPSVRDFAYGGLLDQTFWNFNASLGFRYRGAGEDPEGIQLLGSLKTVVASTDIFADVVYRNDNSNEVDVTTLGGFYRDWEKFRVYGEYQASFADEAVAHAVGAVAIWKKIGGSPFDLGIKWLHSFEPDSGAVAPGISWKPFTYITANVLVPVVYGYPGEYDILDEDMPLTQRLALALIVKISAPIFK